MSKETKALITVDGVVTQVKPVPVSSKTATLVRAVPLSGTARVNSSAANSTVEKQPLATVRFGRVVVKNEVYKSAAFIAISSFFVAVAVVVFLMTVVIPVYHHYVNYVYNTKVAGIAGQQAPDTFRVASAYTDYELSSIASQEHTEPPKMIEQTTRLDSIVGVSDELQYNFTLVDISSGGVSWASVRSILEKSLVNWVCTTRHLVETFINKGVTVSFAYFGNDRNLIGVISVEPPRCASEKIALAK